MKCFCFAVLAFLGLSGCQGNLKPLNLSWVKPQSTTRQQAIAKLGPPARVLDQNRVMAWRIAIMQPDQYDWLGSPIEKPSDCKVGDAEKSLILLFNPQGFLQQWQLVQLKEGGK